jgi:hypothetical protein
MSALIPRAAVDAQAGRAAPSTAWMTATNYLGIENFQCDCTISTGSGNAPRNFEFRSEPVVLGVMRRGPSYGILRRGDVITHIDGVSILTAAGARRFSSIVPGDDVDLTIKRSGRTMKVALHAPETAGGMYTPAPGVSYSIGWDEPAVAPTPPAAAVAPRVWSGRTPAAVQPAPAARPGVPSIPAAPGVVWVGPTPAVSAVSVLPRGWYGFSVRCNGCGWTTISRDEPPMWESPEIPEVSRVDSESPAGRAGIRTGDRITHVDGLSITSPEGARRFGSAEPGHKVRLTVRRGGSTLHREVTVGTRPEARAVIAATTPRSPRTPAPPSVRRQLRYTGQLDNVSVEVWSPGGPTIDRIGNTMVITVGSSVVRIKVDPKKSPE